jgi:hypothetical protein
MILSTTLCYLFHTLLKVSHLGVRRFIKSIKLTINVKKTSYRVSIFILEGGEVVGHVVVRPDHQVGHARQDFSLRLM